MAGQFTVAHFTLDGQPLCNCHYPANFDRLNAAGNPPCEDIRTYQLRRVARLTEQFPNRIALVFAPCPTHGG